MVKRRTKFWVFVGALAVFTAGIVVYALVSPRPGRDLGLSSFDLTIGGPVDVEMLRAKTKAAADAYLAQCEAKLTNCCGGPYEVAIDYSLASRIRSLGYRSSFYYSHWDIYLPYSLVSRSGRRCSVVVQLSDGGQGQTNGMDGFRVLRAVVLDDKGRAIERFEN